MSALYDLMFLDITTAIKVEAAAGAVNIDVDTTTGMSAKQGVTIVLDDASTHYATISSVTDSDTIVISPAIPTGRKAEVDAVVKSYDAFMCRQDGETKDYRITDSPLLPEIMITGEASYTNIDPEKEIQIIQNDWRKGFQDLMLEDSYKYYESENCDARLKGQVTLAPKKLAAISFGSAPSCPSITDAGIESWTGNTPDNWTETGDGVDDNAVTVHGGSHSAHADEYTGTIYQDLSWSNSLRGHTFTASVYYYGVATDAGDVKIKINDGVGETETSADGTDGEWVQLSVSRTLAPGATQLRIIADFSLGLNEEVFLDDFSIEMTSTFGAATKIVDFGDDIVVAMGNHLWNISTGSAVWIVGFPKAITDLCVYQNRLFIAQGWSDEYFYTSDLSTFTECELANSTAKHMANVGNSQFWISDTNSTMTDSDDPINGGTAFSAPSYQVGSDAWDITGLVDDLEVVFCRKEDDVYYLSGSDVLSLLNLNSEASTTYTYGLYKWGDNLYIPSGVNSLYEYDVSAGTATVISPVRYAPGDPNYDEEVLTICHDETYLYCAIDLGSDIKILAGRWETVDSDTDWYWHPLYDKTMNDITCMLISSLSGAKKLYLGTDTYTDGIVPCWVSTSYSQPYTETNYECEASGTFITPWFTTNFPNEDKTWSSVDITSICCTDKTSITPYYQIKGGSWTALTALTTSAYDGGYPDETTDNRTIGQTSERIRFKFVMAAAVDEYTPILYGLGGGIVAHAVLQTDRKRQIEATIVLAPQIRDRNSTVQSRTVSTDLTTLRAYYAANEQETVVGPDETQYSVTFAREGYEEQLAYGPKSGDHNIVRREEWWITLRLLEAA